MLLDRWLELGLDFDRFWLHLPGEALRIVRARTRAEQAEIEAVRATNHELAQLVALAYHQPSKVPKYKPLEALGATRDGEATEADHDILRAHLHAVLGGQDRPRISKT